MIIRHATAEDFIALYGELPKHTVSAEVVELDGKAVAIGGVAYGGERPLLFSRMTDEFRAHKRLVVLCARYLAARAKNAHAVAVADGEKPLAAKLLKRAGLEKVAECPEGEVFG